MTYQEIKKHVRDLIAGAPEYGMTVDMACAAVIDGANLYGLVEDDENTLNVRDILDQPTPPELDLHDANDKLRDPIAEQLAGLLEEFFSTSIRRHAAKEVERPHVVTRLAIGAVEAASRCVQQAAYECESSMPVDEIHSAAIGLFLVVQEIREELESRS